MPRTPGPGRPLPGAGATLSGSERPLIRLPLDALVVLAGPSGAGKSTWAARWFEPSQVVGSDRLRAVVGEHEHDLRASAAAFDVLDRIIEHRLARGLLTVVDTLGMDPERHAGWVDSASRHGRAAHLVVFDEEDKVYRSRNKARSRPVPPKVHKAQLATWVEVRPTLDAAPGFVAVHQAGPVATLAPALLDAGRRSAPVVPPSDVPGPTGSGPPTTTSPRARMRFDLLVSAFDVSDGASTASDLKRVAVEAEAAGFRGLWLMDHYLQIPQVGREWDPMLEPYTALGFLAGVTERLTLGTLVSCVTHRSLGHLAASVAALDVLSEGRARCGLGVGWYEREHRAYGHRFPPLGERYDLLADALEVLPRYWGPGAPAYEGRRFATPEALCYPRPVQDTIPLLVGGSGRRRTLRLVAARADACNLFGGPDEVAAGIAALDDHCRDLGRDRHTIEVTQLSPILSAPDAATLADVVDFVRPPSAGTAEVIRRTGAAPAEVHADRFADLAAVGVETVIVSLADVYRPGALADFAPVIDAFRP